MSWRGGLQASTRFRFSEVPLDRVPVPRIRGTVSGLASGDGEVALTALEAPLRATLRFDVVPRATARAEFGDITGPLVRTSEYLVPTGLDPDLDEAMRKAVRAALDLLHARYGMDEHLAYAYLSAATDFDISQVVDIVCGVHARIRESDFAAVAPPGSGA